MDAMKHATHTQQLGRIRRVEGQIGGVARMVEEQRYCVDILTQLRAARSALKRIEEAILRDHIEHCIASAFKSGRRSEQAEKIDELLDVISRFGAS
jgi:DNA-binding FrmR family transcriptional regulator